MITLNKHVAWLYRYSQSNVEGVIKKTYQDHVGISVDIQPYSALTRGLGVGVVGFDASMPSAHPSHVMYSERSLELRVGDRVAVGLRDTDAVFSDVCNGSVSADGNVIFSISDDISATRGNIIKIGTEYYVILEGGHNALTIATRSVGKLTKLTAATLTECEIVRTASMCTTEIRSLSNWPEHIASGLYLVEHV